jgi:hypothetical protein
MKLLFWTKIKNFFFIEKKHRKNINQQQKTSAFETEKELEKNTYNEYLYYYQNATRWPQYS